MNLSVVIIPAKVLTNGKHKIRIAISHNCETRYKVTRFVVDSPKNVKNGRVVGKDIPDASYINIQLGSIMQSMYKAYDKIPNAECYTCSQLLEKIEQIINVSSIVTIRQIADEWLELMKRQKSDGTYKLYKIGINQFIDFVGEDFVLSMLTPTIIKKYEEYLNTRECKRRTKVKTKLSSTSISMRLNHVSFLVNYATSHKYISLEVNPFIDCDTYNIPARDLFLPVSVLRDIRDVKLDNLNSNIVRDIFMLSFYLCGINYADLITCDFSSDTLSFHRIKNKNTKIEKSPTEFSIQPEARAIINKYITKSGKLDFGGRTTKEQIISILDIHLPKIRTLINTDLRIVYYCARKTFSQFCNMLGVQERIIKYCLGDSTRSNTDILIYYTKTNKQMADEAIRKVLDFVASDCDDPLKFNESYRKEH